MTASRRLRPLVLVLVLAAAAGCGEVAPSAIDAAPIDAVVVDTPSDVTLTVARAGTAMGRVTSTPAGIDCGGSCTLTTSAGTTVTLTATPDVGATFAGWAGGGCSGTATTCAVTLGADATVTATFNTARYTVTLNLMGNGTGSVTSTPAGLSCPGTCTMTVDHGAMLALAAAPAASSTFVGWSGSCVGTGTCALTVTADTTVTAGFALNSSLVVVKAGNGDGTVTSAPAGITCGADCAEAYTPGTIVTLTAVAATGSTFTGWSGGGCTGAGVCSITLNAAQMVTATFTLNQYTLTVARNGNGTGTVTSSPAGITCGADCTELLNHGSPIVLTAAAGANATFVGWAGGGCTGAGTCTVTLTAATTVTATFNLVQHTLTVAKAGTGTGTVTSSPAGIACGADCTEPYNFGQVVVLTAAAATGSTFTSWSGGGCAGAGTCTVTISAATTVTATFTGPVTTSFLINQNAAGRQHVWRTDNTTTLLHSITANDVDCNAAEGSSFGWWPNHTNDSFGSFVYGSGTGTNASFAVPYAYPKHVTVFNDSVLVMSRNDATIKRYSLAGVELASVATGNGIGQGLVTNGTEVFASFWNGANSYFVRYNANLVAQGTIANPTGLTETNVIDLAYNPTTGRYFGIVTNGEGGTGTTSTKIVEFAMGGAVVTSYTLAFAVDGIGQNGCP